MRAAVLRATDRPFEIEEIHLGELRPDEVLVRVVASGMCHTDLIMRNPALAAGFRPIILGHEGSGVVEAVGNAVTQTKPGDHVALSFDACGWCRSCLAGNPAYCVQFEVRNVTGARADGTLSAVDQAGADVANRWFGQSSFAEYAIATERNIVVVPDDVPLEVVGPLGCGLQTGAGSVFNAMRLRPGQSLAVLGAGAVGLAAVMAAKIAGARDIVVVDLHESRLALAEELGATRTIRGDAEDLASAIRNGADGVDFSFETTSVTALIGTAIAVLRRPGKAVLVGAGAGRLDIHPSALTGRTVTFALEGGAIPQLLLPRLIEEWRAGRFPFEKLITTYPLAAVNQAEADSISGKTVKPVLLMN
ncbi:NAD(P)-dependent alcohol dehydrogenase [Leifsonia sp. AG29]|uniref:NAD(P)-dependent alcohol dehydrogenase n=1 Tax=Leifsonia sp. AG29 TaxID=2598860 RepID=UPI00131C3E72|nr:NAD(P)-dependent alcohol dehydrogenase [Leifsonia sp. AG29]